MSVLDKLKKFFNNEKYSSFLSFVNDLEEDEAEWIYYSLNENDKAVFNMEGSEDQFENLVITYTYVKFVLRAVDARCGRNTWDDENDRLVVTPRCTMLELPIDLNTYLYLVGKGFYSIGDVLSAVDDMPESMLSDIAMAVKEFENDTNVAMLGE